MNFLFKKKKVNLQWISWWFQLQELQRQGDFPERFQRFRWSSSGKQFWVIPRSQSAYEYSESSWNDKPQFLPAARYTELIWHVRKRFWRPTCTEWTSSRVSLEIREVRHQHRAILCLWIQGDLPSEPMHWRETLDIFAISTPRFARTFSTWTPPSHAEGACPQNCMVEQPRNQVSEMHFDKFPYPSTFQCWKTSFKTEACFCSSFPTDAVLWIKEVEMVESVDDLETSQSIGGQGIPEF